MKKILVTGWAWFVGTNLCIALLQAWNEVICLDNMYTALDRNRVLLSTYPNLSRIDHDVREPRDIYCDMIYHLACPASPPHYQKNSLYTLQTSISGIINALELAKKYHIPILFTSTSEIYGDPAVHPQPESYRGHVNPIGIRSCYDEGKRVAETYCMEYHKAYGVAVKIVRIFNTYGPYMDPKDGRVVSNFIMQALQDQDLTIYWDGSQTRSFQYVDDLIAGLIAMMQDTSGWTGPVNIGTQYEFTMYQLATLILKLIPESKSQIAYRPLPSDDPKQRKADNCLAKERLWWEPMTPLSSGLIPTITYFKSFLHI